MAGNDNSLTEREVPKARQKWESPAVSERTLASFALNLGGSGNDVEFQDSVCC